MSEAIKYIIAKHGHQVCNYAVVRDHEYKTTTAALGRPFITT